MNEAEYSVALPLPATVARRLPDALYQRSISAGLTRALGRAGEHREISVDSIRAVIFSDHHRGRGDGADDFRCCEEAYAAALGWYLQAGYELWLLGDVEELWENGPEAVLERYEEILRLEREFGPRLVRFFGNHDMAWRDARTRSRYLDRWLQRAPVHESMTVVVTDGRERIARLVLLHGHQGTLDSGNFLVAPFARLAVRFVWARLQRLLRFPSTSPASDAVLRSKHDRAMERWADGHRERIVLVAGHTHRPVFPDERAPDRAKELREAEEDYIQSSGDDRIRKRAKRQLALVRAMRAEPRPALEGSRPCYFNTGCCSFGDGDVTGLELAEGKVRLVRWLADDGTAKPKCLAKGDMRQLFGRLSGDPPDRARAVEVP
jgi:hypothetical protein